MALKHMKMDKQDMEKTMAIGPERTEAYPYGLRIRLGEAELKKLGMSDLPEVGDEIELDAKVKVVGTNASASERQKNRSVELQITHMELDTDDEPSGAEKAAKVYPAQGK